MNLRPSTVAFLVAAGLSAHEAPVLPGLQADGAILLHNQWPIRPAGRQVLLGDFPVAAAVHPGGRFAAVLHAGYGPHGVMIVQVETGEVAQWAPIHETFSGLAFSADGTRLYCGGGSDLAIHVFAFDARSGRLTARREIPVPAGPPRAVVGGLALAPDSQTAYVTLLYTSKVVALDLSSGAVIWRSSFDRTEPAPPPKRRSDGGAADASPDDNGIPTHLEQESNPFVLAVDAPRHRLYASLWGRSEVAVLDSRDGRLLARWPAGLHPNDLALSADGARLFVSNGGVNSVSVLDTHSGGTLEVLTSSMEAVAPPGSTPDSLCLDPEGHRLYVANAYTNTVAVFDVQTRDHTRPLAFIPTGWFPSAVRFTPDGRRLLILNARGVTPLPNAGTPPDKAPVGTNDPGRVITVNSSGEPSGLKERFRYGGSIYRGSLAILDMPEPANQAGAFKEWTAAAERCHPAAPAPVEPGNPIPVSPGGATPIRYVIYIIKENRTYDQVFGDMPEGNGRKDLCLFPEAVTPNLHRLARQFVLLDNFYANAEVSASGHEWSMAGYSSEFVERSWPVNYGHKKGNISFPAQGAFAAAVPASGYLWDQAAAAGLTFRDYGEFVEGKATRASPSKSDIPALRDHVDPYYRTWDLDYSDLDRMDRFVSELHRFEAAGEMPRLQILWVPNDHTQAAKAGALSPRAMVAQNDLAIGRLVEAVSHSRFWGQTALFVVEDDAQNGPDHVDTHRTEALAISPYARHRAVDSTAYTTCSMLHTIELILGFQPMSQFDAAAAPMRASFQAQADLSAFRSVAPQVSLAEKNPADTAQARESARMNFRREDAIDEATFNRVLWASMRGSQPMPAPVRAAFVRPLPSSEKDDD